jgi:hypothetical protein
MHSVLQQITPTHPQSIDRLQFIEMRYLSYDAGGFSDLHNKHYFEIIDVHSLVYGGLLGVRPEHRENSLRELNLT